MSDVGVKCAGHEGAGVIVKVGENVKELAVGQRAGYKPIQNVCHQCLYCKSGRDQYCLKAVFTGGACDGKYPVSHGLPYHSTDLRQVLTNSMWYRRTTILP